MAINIPVPSVTPDDLLRFHTKHFGRQFTGALISDSENSHGQQYGETNNDCGELDDDEEDYGLGYYPDGAKRTLTDEQIAIFRHSEIQRLLLKHRREAEAENECDSPALDNVSMKAGLNADADSAGRMSTNTSISPARSPAKEDPAAGDNANEDGDDDDDEEYARFLEKEREQFALDAEKKRSQFREKHHRHQHNSVLDRTVSTRRRVRELDDVAKQQDVTLDY